MSWINSNKLTKSSSTNCNPILGLQGGSKPMKHEGNIYSILDRVHTALDPEVPVSIPSVGEFSL